jgi:hypothetical protein
MLPCRKMPQRFGPAFVDNVSIQKAMFIKAANFNLKAASSFRKG